MDFVATFFENLTDKIKKIDTTPLSPMVTVSDWVASAANGALAVKNDDCENVLLVSGGTPISFVFERPDTTTYDGENGVVTGGRPPTR